MKPECGGLLWLLSLTKPKNECMDNGGKQKTVHWETCRLPVARGGRKGAQSGLPLKLFVYGYMYTLLAFDWSLKVFPVMYNHFRTHVPAGRTWFGTVTSVPGWPHCLLPARLSPPSPGHPFVSVIFWNQVQSAVAIKLPHATQRFSTQLPFSRSQP